MKAQIVALFTVTAGNGFTVTVEVACAVQLPILPITVYTVVLAGVAITVLPVVALKPVDGLHANVEAPPAFKVTEPFAHIVPLFTLTDGLGETVTEHVVVFTHPLTSVPVTV
jgi:hypothetical protein